MSAVVLLMLFFSYLPAVTVGGLAPVQFGRWARVIQYLFFVQGAQSVGKQKIQTERQHAVY